MSTYLYQLITQLLFYSELFIGNEVIRKNDGSFCGLRP